MTFVLGLVLGLSLDELNTLREEFFTDDKNLLGQNACTRADPMEVCTSRRRLQEGTQHVFEHKVDAEIKPVTNQKSSGRCWLFATLNVIRIPFAKAFNVEEFEFSQGYLFFWDKVCVFIA